MSNDPNPYQAPIAETVHAQVDIGNISERDLKKAGAIIKDAGQFWLALILCILCSVIGAAIIPIWYGIRLIQWNNLARKYPGLLTPNSPPGSWPQKFQSALWKLWVGLGGGLILSLLVMAALLLATIPAQTTIIR